VRLATRQHATVATAHATQLDGRSILRMAGADVFSFLQACCQCATRASSFLRFGPRLTRAARRHSCQGLVTNDMRVLQQGKGMSHHASCSFFVVATRQALCVTPSTILSRCVVHRFPEHWRPHYTRRVHPHSGQRQRGAP